jgi:hypothetical protein
MMGRMSSEAGETVVEFGGPAQPQEPARRRASVTQLFGGLAADRRSVPVAAAVGAVALFASLLSEWQITVLNTQEFGESRPGDRAIPAGVSDLGTLGAGYVVGLFLLAGAVTLVLFGPSAGRRHARLLGLASGGVLAGLLAALTQTLSTESRAINLIYTFELTEEQLQLSYGRGLWCAFAGVAAVSLALWLAGRHLRDAPPESEPAPGSTPEVWSWRRPASTGGAPPDQDEPAPIDLTVTSTTPFTSRSEDRDGEARRGDTP